MHCNSVASRSVVLGAVNSELMTRVRRSHGLHANPFLMFPRIIVSMTWLPQMRSQRLLRDESGRVVGLVAFAVKIRDAFVAIGGRRIEYGDALAAGGQHRLRLFEDGVAATQRVPYPPIHIICPG